jgi:hypothetical protein
MRRTQVAPQHAQRRHPRQTQQGRQTERQHQQDARRDTQQRRQQLGGGKPIRIASPSRCTMPACASQPSSCPAAGEQPERAQLQQVQAEQAALGGAETAQQGKLIEMPLHVAAQRHLRRGSGKQHGQQGGQAEITLRAIKHLTQFRPRITHIFQLFAAPSRGFAQRGSRDLDLVARPLPSHQQAIHHPAAHLDQAGTRQILGIQQQARRQCHEIAAALAFKGQDRGNPQAR